MKDRTDFQTGNLSVLHAIVRLAAEHNVPLGIIRLKSDALCHEPVRTSYKNLPMLDIFSDLLSGTGWKAVYERGVVEIRPNLVPEAAKSLLSMRFDDFYAPSTTLQGVGIILSGYVLSRIRPGEGYAGNIIENPTAEHISAFHLRNVSVQEIMDYVASRGGNGIWIVAPTTEEGLQILTLRDLRVNLYGYKDDASVIEQLSACGQPTQ